MASKISMPVSVYALGGLGEVGKNTYCIENEKTLIIIDAGVLFPGNEFPGIDYLVPDYTHLKNNRNKIKALFITHGHEDHIGGIPYLIQNVNIPVIYAPKLAAALIKHRLEEYRLVDRVKIVEYDDESQIKVDDFLVTFFRVTHSIPDSFGIVVDTPEGRIVTTGDFKIDLTPIGPDIQLNKIADLGRRGVTLLLSDSTNAENEGYTPSERNVFESINEIFTRAEGRLIVSTFSSNISRIQQICEAAVLHHRKIAIVGKSMENAVAISRSYGYIKIPDDAIIDVSEIRRTKLNEIVVLCTGSQGEPMAALSRIATGDHKDIRIIPGDTVVFSSSAIPGNGISINNVVDELAKCGANVITNSILSDIHSSGHPAKQELRLMFKLIKPKYFMPVHGEHRMQVIHAELAQSLGIPKENCFVCDNGDSVVISHHKCEIGYRVPSGVTFIDGNKIDGLAPSVIKDRKVLTDDGMVAVVIGIDTKTNQLIVAPKIYTNGFVYRRHQNVMKNTANAVEKEIKIVLAGKANFADLKNTIKKVAGSVLYKETKRNPMIIPLIMSKN
ncbi:MAG: ribonuclease J [Erysipelotrichaceae bacterium]|nr:ribonuclease J [Erysipelotrichaceae bacterium]